jgi:hypothetical protein
MNQAKLNQANWRLEKPKGSRTQKIKHILNQDERVIAAVFDVDGTQGAINAQMLCNADRMLEVLKVFVDEKVRGYDKQTGAQVVTLPLAVIDQAMKIILDVEGAGKGND